MGTKNILVSVGKYQHSLQNVLRNIAFESIIRNLTSGKKVFTV